MIFLTNLNPTGFIFVYREKDRGSLFDPFGGQTLKQHTATINPQTPITRFSMFGSRFLHRYRPITKKNTYLAPFVGMRLALWATWLLQSFAFELPQGAWETTTKGTKYVRLEMYAVGKITEDFSQPGNLDLYDAAGLVNFLATQVEPQGE